MTINIERRSPIRFNIEPVKIEMRGGWKIARRYAKDPKGLHIVDLSHFPRWDMQDNALENLDPYGNRVPEAPGRIYMEQNLLIGRLNKTQAIAWHFATESPVFPKSPSFTDITDSAAAMALVGPSVFDLVEKLCSLDLSNPHEKPPFLLQGPFSHVPCHIWVLHRDGLSGCIALTCSRGYARDVASAVLEAGAQWGISPEGEDRFRSWMRW
ncbi:MAG: sarcosine oxidase subunit gamma SoxG [Desulfobacterales bacterium]